MNARYRRALRLQRLLWLLLPLVLLLGLGTGSLNLSAAEVLGGLLAPLTGADADQAGIIVQQLRLPRTLLAGLIGAMLAASGAAMQGLFRNPLADPSLIGVTAGATLGASLVIVAGGELGGAIEGLTLISLGAFAGGLLTVIVVYRLATTGTGTSVATMLLAGIAITALAGSVGNLLEFFADNTTLRRISLWRMGGLDGASYERLLLAGPVAALVLAALPRFAPALDALLLGESEARHLGIDVERTKQLLVVLVAVGVGTAVALGGTIAFVGLVVPHIIRLLIGPTHRQLLPASAVAGAILLIIADSVARVVVAPAELPVGIVTALIGVPFFVSLLRRRDRLRLG